MGVQLNNQTESIEIGQRRLRPVPSHPRNRHEYRKVARWWELEALRGYPSANLSRQYAAAQRWLAELAGLFGPGTPAELLKRSRNQMPEFTNEPIEQWEPTRKPSKKGRKKKS